MHLMLQLFVSGTTARSKAAIAQAKHIRERYPEGVCELEIIDVMCDADRAENQRILATPTLVKVSPLPVLRIVGDLRDLDQVLQFLDPPAGRGRWM